MRLYASQPAPYQELDSIRKTLPEGGLSIMSKLEKTLRGYENYVVVEEMPKTKIDAEIKKVIDQDNSLYIDADAIRHPYFQYDGQNWEINSTTVGGPGEHKSSLEYLYSDFNFDLIKTSQYQYKTGIFTAYLQDKDLGERLKTNISALENGQALIMGRIVDQNINQPVSRLLVDIYSKNIPLSRQRINYHDWLYYLYHVNSIDSNREFIEPIHWAYTDKDGYFVTFAPEKELNWPIELYATSYNLSTFDMMRKFQGAAQFTREESVNLTNQTETVQGEIDISQLNVLLEKIKQAETYYLIIKKFGQKIFYQYIVTRYELSFSDKLEAENMASEIGNKTNEAMISSRDQAGFLVFGPWLSLPQGKYEVSFRIKITDFENRDEIGLLEIIAENRDKPLVQKTLRLGDFDGKEKYKNISLDFESSGDTGVEFRTKSNGAVSIWLESISLVKKP